MKVVFDPKFYKQYKKANVRTRNRVDERIRIFRHKQMDPILNNHTLKDDYLGHRSIDITGNWRAIYRARQIGKETIAHFTALGTHGELYRKRRTS